LSKVFPDHVTVNGIEQMISKMRKRMLTESGVAKNDPDLIEKLYTFYRYRNTPKKAPGTKIPQHQDQLDESDEDDAEDTEDEDSVEENVNTLTKLVIGANTGLAHVVKSTPSKSKAMASTPYSRASKKTVDTSSEEPRPRPRRSATQGVKYTMDITSSDDDTLPGGNQSFFAREHSPSHDPQLIKVEHHNDIHQAQFGVIDTVAATTSDSVPVSSFALAPIFTSFGEHTHEFMSDYTMSDHPMADLSMTATMEDAPRAPQFDYSSSQMLPPAPFDSWANDYESSPDQPQAGFRAVHSSYPTLTDHYSGSFATHGFASENTAVNNFAGNALGLGVGLSNTGNHQSNFQTSNVGTNTQPSYDDYSVPISMWYN
jgi:hypothetical protein